MFLPTVAASQKKLQHILGTARWHFISPLVLVQTNISLETPLSR